MVTATAAVDAGSIAAVVMLLRFHIYLFNCAINVRACVGVCDEGKKWQNDSKNG